jgi:hypothetical protein
MARSFQRTAPLFAALLAISALAACSSPDVSGVNASSKKKTDDGTGGGSLIGGSGDGVDPSPTATTASDCTEAATFPYVVSEENGLYRFDPSKLTFTKIGQLACPAAQGAMPFGMSVDRTATAWINYTDGSLFRVSTTDASCQKSAYVAPAGFKTFGLGFTSNPGDPTKESLYVVGCDTQTGGSAGLGRIDMTTFALTKVGPFGAAVQNRCGDLTGTGDGRLFGLFDGTPAVFANVAPATSLTSGEQMLSALDTSHAAYAFSFWGGDVWFYTASDGSGSTPATKSKVTHYKAATDGSLSVVVQDTGFTISGAGVSTCAPTKPPVVN